MNFRHFMRIRSFRLRIALFSVVVSGALLVAFAALTLAAVHRIVQERMDKDIKEFAHRHLVEPQGPKPWDRIGDSLKFFLGDDDVNTFIMFGQRPGRRGKVYLAGLAQRIIDRCVFRRPMRGDTIRIRHLSHRHVRARGPKRSPINEMVGGNNPAPEKRGRAFPGRPVDPPPPLKTPEFFTRDAGGTKWRIGMMGNPQITFVLGLNMRRLNEEMAQIRYGIFAMLPIALLLVAAGAWWISQRAL